MAEGPLDDIYSRDDDVDFKHFILTPFYVRRVLNGAERALPSEDWLNERISLFERYCYPSVRSQSRHQFSWLLYMDPSTPAASLQRINDITGEDPRIKICLCDALSRDQIVAGIRRNMDESTRWVLSTRLDNDDGWHEDFVARVQSEVKPGVREFLNFPEGVIVAGQRLYSYHHQSNAFISFSEPSEDMQTPFAKGHELLSEVAPIRQIPGGAAFYQVVHGANFSNKIRGVRITRSEGSRDFKNLHIPLGDAPDERAWKLRIENATIGKVRKFRDLCINAVKSRLKH